MIHCNLLHTMRTCNARARHMLFTSRLETFDTVLPVKERFVVGLPLQRFRIPRDFSGLLTTKLQLEGYAARYALQMK